VNQPGCEALLDMLKHGDVRCCVKVTGI